MLISRRKRQPMGVRESDRVRSPGHLKWVRGHDCILSNRGECGGKIEAHHVSQDGNAGMGVKAPDDCVVPLCSAHHAEGHNIGWVTFAVRYGVDLLAIAAMLWRISPHRKKD